MKRTFILLMMASFAVCGRGEGLALRYARPAGDSDGGWEKEALPVGNGYFGASVFGLVTDERVTVSHGAVYAGKKNANGFVLPTFTCPLELRFAFGHGGNATNYVRTLDLETATAGVSYEVDGVKYVRDCIANYPDKVIAFRLTASVKGKLGFSLKPELPYLGPDKDGCIDRRGSVSCADGGLDVRVDFEDFLLKFVARLEVATDGTVACADGTLRVSDATEATVYLACDTNYTLAPERMSKKCCDPSAPDPLPRTKATAATARTKGWTAVKEDHVRDYRALFGRVTVDLGDDGADGERMTDDLLKDYAKGCPSAYLEELYCQYGRYLLIASSRPGGLPANLQGIWTRHRDSPWTGGYWHNINIQMNYWPSFAGNLMECFEPYAAWHAAMRPVARSGAIYGLQTRLRNHPEMKDLLPKNPYADLSPDAWNVAVGEWPYMVQSGNGAASGLTSKLFMEWWNFTQDERILREHAWPVMHGAAQLLIYNVVRTNDAWLCVDSFSHEQQVRDPATGKLGKYYITTGCAFDQQMIHENNADCLKLAKLLGTNDAVTAAIERQIGHYEPILIGGSGQIKEFREEDKYGEIGEYHHRHISQLMALMPGTLITRDTPEWMAAAKKTLEFRGDQSTGWALAHRLNAWARTGDGEHCHRLIRNLIGTRTYANLWDAHPPFQIDGNLGGTSGILEMLIQSHAGYIELLPSLPKTWAKKGSFCGLRARGGFELDCEWADGRPVRVAVRSHAGGKPDVRFRGKPVSVGTVIP